MMRLVGVGFGKEIGYISRAWYVRYSKLITFYSILHPVQSHIDALGHLNFE